MSLREKYQFQFLEEKNNTLSFSLENSDVLAQIIVLEQDMIRVLMTKSDQLEVKNTWLVAPGMDDVPLKGRDRLDLSPFSLPEYTLRNDGRACIVETELLKLDIDLEGFKITWFSKDGEGNETQIAADRTTQAYNFDGSLGEGIFHYLQRTKDEQYYGLGEKSGDMDRYGKRYRMLSIDPMGYDAQHTDPLYKHIPFYITRSKQTGISFGIFYDNMAQSIFDMGHEMDNYHGWYRYYQSMDGDLDYYIILGPEVKDVVKKYSWLTGKTIFAPKWSFGYSGSTMTYTDAPDAQEQLNKFIEECEEHDILCDSFQLSSGYTSIEDKRYVFNWNTDKFPDAKGFINHYHEKGVKLCANIKPALLKDHPLFSELNEKEMFIKSGDGNTEMSQFWDEVGAYVDFTNEESVNWWKQKVTEQLLEYGIDSTWNDNNEFEIWSKDAQCNGFGEGINFEAVRSLQPLLMMKASYEAQKEFAPDIRPYLISRSGSPGMQRYVQTWSGDNYTSWKSLKYNIKMGLGLSMSGIYNIGHDIGGFSGPAPEPELLVRWVQNGIFHPRFTIHSWNDDKSVNVPWMYEETTGTIRDLIKFRHRITPYLYTALYNAHEKYEPILRPTFYEFESDVKTFEENDDFMLGESMLVASVVEEGQRERTVYLPAYEGGWYDYHTSKWYEGSQTVTIPAPLEYNPLLIKGGSIIPINEADSTFQDKEKDERGFWLFPHKESGSTSYNLYEDDGVSANYQENHTIVSVTMNADAQKIDVNYKIDGEYKLPYESINFYLPENEERKLYVNGEELKKGAKGYTVAL
ncbi:glycoside hydrolase family 31 protein [Metabacillus halosaccharovorans]|uniref:Glycoside hydrolase family 31 protein n=1 Tax=Metabacillus halosaccharovorans TaxID=930124 RepID=A0ABT3DN96_9BACI|nr:glycoside hydrolase family 31 protein [Metabacillus halosaccharovorans]MCV9888535.1 glycoside hydrolase family 31 protein [Metabacillus halosaccharovorans]